MESRLFICFIDSVAVSIYVRITHLKRIKMIYKISHTTFYHGFTIVTLFELLYCGTIAVNSF